MNRTLIVIVVLLIIIITWSAARAYYTGILAGRLRIDHSISDEEPYLFAEFYKGVSDISELKYVTFEVCTEDYLPQKKQFL